MSELKIIDEGYYRLGDAPVMVCMLTLPGPIYWLGNSIAPPWRFDEDAARILARLNAVRSAIRALSEGRMPPIYHAAAAASGEASR